MQHLTVRSLALVLALGTLTVGSINASPAMQDEGDGVIEGYVFLDSDGDGALDLDEPGIEGITVRLEGEVERTAETDLAGGYGFVGLPDGDYDVIVEPGDDYATAELDSYSESIEGEQVLRLDFALAEVDAEADADAAADDEDAQADDETADDTDADDDTADDMDATDDTTEDVDTADEAAMAAVVNQLIEAMGEDASEEDIRAAFESALVTAREDGTESEMTAAIEKALADMDEEAAEDEDVETADASDDAGDMASDDEDAVEADDADDAVAMTKGGEAVDSASEPDDMPATGAGGPLSFGLMLVLLLALIGGLGRTMERRQSI